MTVRRAGRESSELRELRATAHDLQRRSELLEKEGDLSSASELHRKAQEKEQDVMKKILADNN